MLKKIHICDRPREKIASKGAASLTDLELLSAIIGSGNSKKDVFQLAKSVNNILDVYGTEMSLEQLLKIPGVGIANASKILAAQELFKRRIKGAKKIISPKDAFQYVRHLSHKPQEHFISLNLNGAQELIEMRTITIGLLDRVQVHPRELFAPALIDRAAAIIIAHNHPGSDVRPSKADLVLTRRLKKAGCLLGINLLDHIIFSNDDYFSMNENGLMKK